MSKENDDKKPEHMAQLAWLDRLRPPPGWRTDRAVLSTYACPFVCGRCLVTGLRRGRAQTMTPRHLAPALA